jgi:hypothetical protein
VQPGTAIAYDEVDPTSEGNEEKSRAVDFDDPSAHQRNVVVTVRPDWSAGEDPGAEVKVRMGVIGDADPAEFLASLRALQGEQVVMLLDAREDGRHIGDYYPIMGGAMIGRVADNGEISFSGLGAEEKSFVAGVDSIDELRAEAEEPDQVIAP